MATGGSDSASSTCKICKQPFRMPKILPCRHVFCRSCLKGLVEYSVYERRDNTFLCPDCSKKTLIPSCGVEGYQDYLANLFEATSKRRNQEHEHLQTADGLTSANNVSNRNDDDSYFNFTAIPLQSVTESQALSSSNPFQSQARETNIDRDLDNKWQENLSDKTQAAPLARKSLRMGLRTTSHNSDSHYDKAPHRQSPGVPDVLQQTPQELSFLGSKLQTLNGPSLPEPVTKFKCSRRQMYAVSITEEDYVIMVGKVIKILKRPSVKLTIWRADGRKIFNKNVDLMSVTLALAGQGNLLIADKEMSGVFWIFLNKIKPRLITSLTLKRPLLSKTASGDPIYLIGRNDQYESEIQKVNFTTDNASSRKLFTISQNRDIFAFDVSEDGQWFAVATREDVLCVNVYEYGHAQPTQGCSFRCDGNVGDVCFYTPRSLGFEVLLVADNNSHVIVTLDYRKRCQVLGKTYLASSTRLARDNKGRLWAANDWIKKSGEKAKVLVFT